MQDCYPDVVATVGLDVLIINLLNRWWYSGLPEKCKIHRNMNFIIELSELTVLTGEDVWTYLAGQGTNVDVVSIAPPKPGDGGPGILCHFILCFPRVLAVQADLLVIYTPSYFSQVFSNCEDKFTFRPYGTSCSAGNSSSTSGEDAWCCHSNFFLPVCGMSTLFHHRKPCLLQSLLLHTGMLPEEQ